MWENYWDGVVAASIKLAFGNVINVLQLYSADVGSKVMLVTASLEQWCENTFADIGDDCLEQFENFNDKNFHWTMTLEYNTQYLLRTSPMYTDDVFIVNSLLCRIVQIFLFTLVLYLGKLRKTQDLYIDTLTQT